MWDNQTVNYNIEEHNWPKFWLEKARDIYPQIESLETVHKSLTPSEIVLLGSQLQKLCSTEEFINRIDSYYSSIVPSRIDADEYMIQRFFTVRIVIPDQAKAGRLLQFHKDEWTGNGLGILTVWTPITNCYGTNSMQMLSCEDSDYITNQCYQNQWDFDKLQSESLDRSFPVELHPGQAHLFQQNHIHGNVNNDTDISRWSMDGRILPKGGEYHRKLPGGYFRFIGELPDSRPIDPEKEYISYAGWNNSWSGGIPLPMQRATINEYCRNNNIKINDYQFENEFLDWYPSLEQFITSYNVDAIVLCSIYSLPDDPFRRYTILKLAVDNNVELHFANELCSIRQEQDIKHIQQLLEYKI
jgi:sporadic carbohydrate cluster 2OG-Fe(II) oxygenase/sporadic carbohydrate cluster protein (TIGR04323 family)